MVHADNAAKAARDELNSGENTATAYPLQTCRNGGFGDLLTAKDPAGNTITNSYDKRGRKTESGDPDMGDWTYSYDALSELTEQVDAKSQHTTLGYDLLGRTTQRTEPERTNTVTGYAFPCGNARAALFTRTP